MKSDMRWLLFITAIIGIIGYADALKATSLKTFGRNGNKTASAATSKTTTSTTVATVNTEPTSDDEVEKADEAEDVVTKPPLTGIPQIDYVWDPNLPRELNGFNLSTYPFLNSVPDSDDIDFKCDGHHDGFYASIKYSCQLYHHCIYGIRHDFLCANFTAFDQKTFICHFVSEVNCKSSAKYWFRNDALYKATTTTSTTTTTIAPPPTTSQAPEKPYRRPDSRRPLRRRRPHPEYYYDDDEYFDDYVEERMNRRHKTNRNRNRRPEYDDDDDDASSYRTSSDKMPTRANIKDEEDDYSYERPAPRQRNRNRDDADDYDRRPYERPRNRKRPIDNKRQHDDEDKGIDDTDDRRPHSDARKYNHDSSNRRHKTNRNRNRRPEYDDYDASSYRTSSEKIQRVSGDEYDERPLKRPAHDSKPEIVPKVRSSSAVASIFNRPRAPPKINRPVPINEKKKYEYVPQKPDKATTVTALVEDAHYDDDYDYEGEKQPEIEPIESKKTVPVHVSQTREQLRPAQRNEFKHEKPHSPSTDVIEEEEFDIKSKVSSIKPQRSAASKIEPSPQEMSTKTEYYDERPKNVVNKPNPKRPIDFNKDEYIPDDDFEYADEEADDRITKSEEITHSEAPRNEYRVGQGKLPEHHSKVIPETIDREPKPQQERPSLDVPQVKTKFHRLSPPTNIRTAGETFQPKPSTEPEDRDVYRVLTKEAAPTIREPSGFRPVGFNTETDSDSDFDSPKNRPYVRVMKRPFLPSRGGSIYLPRGLKAVGGGITTEYTTENIRSNSNPSNMGNLHLFDHSSLPINNNQSPNTPYFQYHQLQSQPQQQLPARPAHLNPLDLRTTTQPPQIESPRSPLDEIFNNDYDVTLNDALNPTLKPLSQSHESPIGFSLTKYDRSNPFARADVSHSPSQYRSTTIQKPKSQSQAQAQTQSQYYDDEYEY